MLSPAQETTGVGGGVSITDKTISQLCGKLTRHTKSSRKSSFVVTHAISGLNEDVYFQPPSLIERQTPEHLFHQVWVRGVIANVLRALEQESHATGKETHFRLFQARVVGPELRGETAPPLESLARELGLDYKDAANRLVTAKRAFARLLAQEVRAYTGGEEEAAIEKAEVLELLRLDG